MKRTIVGTRITTECGHSWKSPRLPWTRRMLSVATTNCKHCGELLLIPGEQFEGKDLTVIPAEFHAVLFHREMNRQDSNWPADGGGTGYVEFSAE